MRDVPTGKSLLSFWSLGERHIPKKFNFDFDFKKWLLSTKQQQRRQQQNGKGKEKKYLTEQALNSGLQRQQIRSFGYTTIFVLKDCGSFGAVMVLGKVLYSMKWVQLLNWIIEYPPTHTHTHGMVSESLNSA